MDVESSGNSKENTHERTKISKKRANQERSIISASRKPKDLQKQTSILFGSSNYSLQNDDDVESSRNSKENTPERTKISKKPANQERSIISASRKPKELQKQTSILFGSSNYSLQNDDGFQNCLKNMENRMVTIIRKEIKNAKNSILYDLKKRMDSLSTSLLENGIETTVGKIKEEKKKLDIQLPICDLETFKTFDEAVKNDLVKNSAFKSLIKCLLQGSTSVSEGIRNCLPFFMGKEVQLQYTATGRKVKGVGKDNFGDTYTYQCMAACLLFNFKV
ncbi:uncharacterized protein LOC117171075 [Belonocnema kinseyi]|uniref:uncharacterized protein LOC117171075 n=1 Tax=Belonocnema kinseyi TaxID=2817044 RepID=UPI00143DE585|nr:uncharacterized protein LOC117171075 [Belonocnema kinseyi]